MWGIFNDEGLIFREALTEAWGREVCSAVKITRRTMSETAMKELHALVEEWRKEAELLFGDHNGDSGDLEVGETLEECACRLADALAKIEQEGS